MGKFRIGSGLPAPQNITAADEIEIEIPKITEVSVERVIKIPVVREVEVEVQKPVFKLVEVEEKIQKPKIIVEEIPQVVIKPVFSIKQETVILDNLQKKLDESVKLAKEKIKEIDDATVEKAALDHKTLTTLQNEARLLKISIAVSIVLSAASLITSFLR